MSREEDLRNRVREAIAASGRTQAGFARSIDLDPTKLSKALAGTRRFTPLELALIAEQGRRSVDWLLYGASERPSLAARAQEADVSDVVQKACARAEELDEVYTTLAAAGCVRQVPALPSIRLSGRLIDQGAVLATGALEFVASSGVGASEERCDGLPEMIERVFGVDVGIEALPPGFDGLSWSRNGFRLILVSNSGSWTRQQFTLAHELGHILAGDAQDLRVDVDVMSSAVRLADTEMRANSFAASFLMPERDVKASSAGNVDEDSFARLVGRLGVSPSALSWRLLNLGLIGDDERARLGTLTLRACAVRGGWLERYRARTRDQSEVRRPGLLSHNVLEAFETGRVSARVAARVLEIQPETLLPPPLPAELDDNAEDDLVFIP
ncbi:MAG: helix-turn-helix domain-containing protein [Pseudonocardiaceae bacterium]